MSEPRWDLVYKWADPETRSLVDKVASALENCDRKLTEASRPAPRSGWSVEEREEEDGSWSIVSTALPGLVVAGATREGAWSMWPEVVELWASTANDARRRPAPQPLDVERLAQVDHEWSMANDRRHCAAHYVPVRPCTPDDHMEWAESILARLTGGQDR